MADKYWAQSRNVTFRSGIVSALGTAQYKGFVRVRFPDRDNIESAWLQVLTRGTQGTKHWHIPEIGAQVKCSLDEHDENGSIDGELWSSVDAPVEAATNTQDRTDYSDGTSIVYDTAAHTLTVQLGTSGSATINTPLGNEIALASDGTVLLQDRAGSYIKLNGDGTIKVHGQIVSDSDMVAIGISATQHVHGDVQSGGATTSGPQG
jgi:phage baseplate assembly protein V